MAMNDRITPEEFLGTGISTTAVKPSPPSTTAATTQSQMALESRLMELVQCGNIMDVFVALQNEIGKLRLALNNKNKQINELNNAYLKTIQEHNVTITQLRKEMDELDARYSAPFKLWEQMRVIAKEEAKGE